MSEKLCFNGINGATGQYAVTPMTQEELANRLAGDSSKTHLDTLLADKLGVLRQRSEKLATRAFGVVDGVNPQDIASAGWGAILPYDVEPAIKEALQPLFDLRQQQAGPLFRVFDGPAGYDYDDAAGTYEDKDDWLARDPRNATPGDVEPEKCPYYLLIVGGPDKIPYQFQYELGVNYAVGRIHFESAVEYARYATGVVQYETGESKSNRKGTFFAVANSDDRATELSASQLAQPLEGNLKNEFGGWTWQTVGGAEAKRARLGEILEDPDPPSLLFTASHGMEFPANDARHRNHQGALLCGDWPGPNQWNETIPDSWYFSADNVKATANLNGMIAFIFACYGAGTPRYDDFHQQAYRKNKLLTKTPFVARLPQTMLANPGGGALAAVAHVERAWSYSFLWPDVGEDVKTFDSVLSKTVKGLPLGFAMEHFSSKLASLMMTLQRTLNNVRMGDETAKAKLPRYWTSTYDARNYILLGDPAVRLKV